MAARDFDGLASRLLQQADTYARAWFPAGRLIGSSWAVGSLKGDPGDGLTVDLSDGSWFDAPSGGSGGDLIALYAAKEGIPDTLAYDRLTAQRVECIGCHLERTVEAGAPPGYCSAACAKHTQGMDAEAEQATAEYGRQAETDFTQPTGKTVSASVGSTKRATPTLAIVGGRDGNAARKVDPTAVIAEGRPLVMRWQELGLGLSGNGQPFNNLSNAVHVVGKELADQVWFDTFHRNYYTTWRGAKRQIEEEDVFGITTWMQGSLGLSKMSDELVGKAIRQVAKQNKRNEVQEWLRGLTWDGKPRVREFFGTYLTASGEASYLKAVGLNFWVGLAARIVRPGVKMDNMIVLEGKQGLGKSRAIQAIGGEWYASVHVDVQSKDFIMAMCGKLVIEISELQSFQRADFTAIKKILSDTEDRIRPPFERVAQDFKRQCVFIGSTNEDAYLHDPTGARRFWPVDCGATIDIEGITRDRDQLFAEARTLAGNGEAYYFQPPGAVSVQDDRRLADVWENRICDWLRIHADEEAGVRLEDVMERCLEIPVARQDVATERRVGKTLRALGWRNVKRGTPKRRVWVKEEQRHEVVRTLLTAEDEAF